MNKAIKLREAMKNHPLGWQIGDLQSVDRQHGIIWRHDGGRRMSMYALEDYPFEMRPLKPSEGGGYLIAYPDFTECIADGETLEEALQHGREALQAVIEALQEQGMAIPTPNSGGVASGKFIARVPKSIHAQFFYGC